jgi:ferritin-like metal-binding protein YciE
MQKAMALHSHGSMSRDPHHGQATPHLQQAAHVQLESPHLRVASPVHRTGTQAHQRELVAVLEVAAATSAMVVEKATGKVVATCDATADSVVANVTVTGQTLLAIDSRPKQY